MARKSKPRSESVSGEAAQAVRESAQKIWLAGLGAYERAKTEGPRMFETLVEQGRSMGARAVGAADEAFRNMRQGRYSGRWDKLEQVFEDRVAKSLGRLGVISRREVEDLSKQVQDLNAAVRDLIRGGGGEAGGKRKAKKRPAAKKRRAAARKRMKRATRASRARRA